MEPVVTLLKVCLISGAPLYESDASLTAFSEYLEANYFVACTLLKAPDKSHLPGLEALDGCDVALFFTRRMEIDGESLARITKYCRSGRGVVAVRTASHGFQNWLEFDKEILGGNYDGHFDKGPTATLTICAEAEDHPIVKGLGELKSRSSLYKTAPLAPDATCLMRASTWQSRGAQPAAWVRIVNSKRVFYWSFGGPQDFQNASFRKMLANALFWAAGWHDVHRRPLPKLADRPTPSGTLKLALRRRIESAEGSGEWKAASVVKTWPVAETALLLCDVWDMHWCASANRRLGEMIPRMNEVVGAARRKGMLVIHAPSETMPFYADTPYRRRAQMAPKVTPTVSVKIADPPLPLDASDGGCDDEPPCHQCSAWTRQHPGIEIASFDAVTDSGQEVYNLLRQSSIKNLIVCGVHTNMCVIGRSFGIKQMTRWGVDCALIRDLTDTMYNPRKPPKVSHERGTELMVEHIEKYWCPSLLSEDLLTALK